MEGPTASLRNPWAAEQGKKIIRAEHVCVGVLCLGHELSCRCAEVAQYLLSSCVLRTYIWYGSGACVAKCKEMARLEGKRTRKERDYRRVNHIEYFRTMHTF